MFQIREKSRAVTKMSEIKEQPVKWLWYPYIPFGKLTVIHGAPDSGKTMFACRLMAACTNQINLEEMEKRSPGNVLYFTADDDLSDMVRPRLIEAGADLSRVFVVNDMLPFTLADDSIEKLIEDFDIQVMIVDPIQEYLEYEVYGDEPELIYPIILKLERIAKHTGCAILVTAYSDGRGGKNGDRWKFDFAEKISSVLCLERAGTEAKESSLIHEKCLLAPEGKRKVFMLEDGAENGNCP
ncbi:MAG TPA: hypothetical protein DCZ40_10025 [Lachnospiraceae bacterium]|nr:hypothetical protein [Lachnospiraceae bacterium]